MTDNIGQSFNGTPANDTLLGDGGNNVLTGGEGNDSLVAGSGDDTFILNADGDIVDGGEGIDTVVFVTAGAGLLADLGAGTSSSGDTLITLENAIGGAFDDTLIGNDGSNLLTGVAGNDLLQGLAGDDLYNLSCWEKAGGATCRPKALPCKALSQHTFVKIKVMLIDRIRKVNEIIGFSSHALANLFSISLSTTFNLFRVHGSLMLAMQAF